MALVVLTLAEMKAHSALAEVQALTDGTLEPLEAEALDLLEAELGRRLTVDTEDVARTLDGLRHLAARPTRAPGPSPRWSRPRWETSPRVWRRQLAGGFCAAPTPTTITGGVASPSPGNGD